MGTSRSGEEATWWEHVYSRMVQMPIPGISVSYSVGTARFMIAGFYTPLYDDNGFAISRRFRSCLFV